MANYTCPKCGGNDFAIDPTAFLNARGTDPKKLPVKCRGCGFEEKPSNFSKHEKKDDAK